MFRSFRCYAQVCTVVCVWNRKLCFHSVVLRLLSRQDDVPVVLYRDGNGDAAHREGFVVDVTRFARFAP